MARGQKGVECVNEQLENLVDMLMSDMETKGVDWQKSWNYTTPYNPITGSKYKGKNALLLTFAMIVNEWGDPRFMTFKQAVENNLSVKKGSHSSPIEYWQPAGWYYLVRGKNGRSTWKQAPNPKTPEEEERYLNSGYQKWRYRLVGCYDLFNAAQIDGLEPYKPEEGLQNAEIVDVLEQHAFCPVEERQSDEAYYSPSLDKIVIPERTQFVQEADMAQVLLHELSHATGHASRLGRDIKNQFGTDEYAREELCAELSSLLTANTLGIETTISNDMPCSYWLSQREAYLKSWTSRFDDPKTELLKAISKAKDASEMLVKQYQEPLQALGATKENKVEEAKAYAYGLRNRPPSIGCQPKGDIAREAFEGRKFDGRFQADIWGFAVYDHELSEKEIKDFELTQGVLWSITANEPIIGTAANQQETTNSNALTMQAASDSLGREITPLEYYAWALASQSKHNSYNESNFSEQNLASAIQEVLPLSDAIKAIKNKRLTVDIAINAINCGFETSAQYPFEVDVDSAYQIEMQALIAKGFAPTGQESKLQSVLEEQEFNGLNIAVYRQTVNVCLVGNMVIDDAEIAGGPIEPTSYLDAINTLSTSISVRILMNAMPALNSQPNLARNLIESTVRTNEVPWLENPNSLTKTEQQMLLKGADLERAYSNAFDVPNKQKNTLHVK